MPQQRIFGFLGLKSALPGVRDFASTGAPYDYALALLVIGAVLNTAYDETGTANKDEEFELGKAWVFKHILKVTSDASYFRSLSNSDKYARTLGIARVIELADLLFNLQGIPGILPIYRRIIRQPEHIEATMLELEGMRMLILSGVGFRLIHSGVGQGLNYECELLMKNGRKACCEMKCKLEGQEFSHRSVMSTLKKARLQLPTNSCGVVILKVPSQWMNSQEIYPLLIQAIDECFRNAKRISRIIAYFSELEVQGAKQWYSVAVEEFTNPNSPYSKYLDKYLTSEQVTLPEDSRWLRFMGMTEQSLTERIDAELADGHAR